MALVLFPSHTFALTLTGN